MTNFNTFSRRQFLMWLAATPTLVAASHSPYLCQESCCIDWMWAGLEKHWFEEGLSPPSNCEACRCGYLPGYRVHDCPSGLSSVKPRQRLVSRWSCNTVVFPLYSCNGLPVGYGDINTDSATREWIYNAILDQEASSMLRGPRRD